MALTITSVQGSRVDLGIDLQEDTKLLSPGTSDYVTGGYVLSSALLGFKAIQQVIITGANATAIATWAAQPVAALATLTGGGAFTSYSQFLFYVYVLSTGAQAASGANLTGAIWQITVRGY